MDATAGSRHRFPFLFGGTFIEARITPVALHRVRKFPFLFGGTFIEAEWSDELFPMIDPDFPSFSEGLSLRQVGDARGLFQFMRGFPFLFGGTFIEASIGVS